MCLNYSLDDINSSKDNINYNYDIKLWTPVPPILTLYPNLTFYLWPSNFFMILATRPIYKLFAAMIGRF